MMYIAMAMTRFIYTNCFTCTMLTPSRLNIPDLYTNMFKKWEIHNKILQI